MAQAWKRRFQKYWSPTNAAVNETTALFGVKAGWRVTWATAHLVANWTATVNSTVGLGDGANTQGYIATSVIDPDNTTVPTLYDGTAAFLSTSGGKLYTADDTIDVTYVAGSATSASNAATIRFTIGVEESEGT